MLAKQNGWLMKKNWTLKTKEKNQRNELWNPVLSGKHHVCGWTCTQAQTRNLVFSPRFCFCGGCHRHLLSAKLLTETSITLCATSDVMCFTSQKIPSPSQNHMTHNWLISHVKIKHHIAWRWTTTRTKSANLVNAHLSPCSVFVRVRVLAFTKLISNANWNGRLLRTSYPQKASQCSAPQKNFRVQKQHKYMYEHLAHVAHCFCSKRERNRKRSSSATRSWRKSKTWKRRKRRWPWTTSKRRSTSPMTCLENYSR